MSNDAEPLAIWEVADIERAIARLRRFVPDEDSLDRITALAVGQREAAERALRIEQAKPIWTAAGEMLRGKSYNVTIRPRWTTGDKGRTLKGVSVRSGPTRPDAPYKNIEFVYPSNKRISVSARDILSFEEVA